MDTNAAAARMLSHSDEFFKYYPVMMAGGTGGFVPNAANLKTYFLAKKEPGVVPPGSKEGHFGATRPGFLHTKNISSFKMDMLAQTNCSAGLATHGVPMVNYNSDKEGKVNLHANIGAMDHYVVDGGANYMTTGLLTGCCFVMLPVAGGFWCVHIRPEGIDAVTLQNDIEDHGHFAGAPGQAVSAFGRKDYGGAYAIVIGVNAPAGWKFYAQTSLDTFKTVAAAWRIQPGPPVRL